MSDINIRARNNLDVPIRLTLTRLGHNDGNDEILIAVGEQGAGLNEYYRICIDTDVLPSKEWGEIGSLGLDMKPTVSFKGIPEQ